MTPAQEKKYPTIANWIKVMKQLTATNRQAFGSYGIKKDDNYCYCAIGALYLATGQIAFTGNENSFFEMTNPSQKFIHHNTMFKYLNNDESLFLSTITININPEPDRLMKFDDHFSGISAFIFMNDGLKYSFNRIIKLLEAKFEELEKAESQIK